jgi:hypothetical protein
MVWYLLETQLHNSCTGVRGKHFLKGNPNNPIKRQSYNLGENSLLQGDNHTEDSLILLCKDPGKSVSYICAITPK